VWSPPGGGGDSGWVSPPLRGESHPLSLAMGGGDPPAPPCPRLLVHGRIATGMWSHVYAAPSPPPPPRSLRRLVPRKVEGGRGGVTARSLGARSYKSMSPWFHVCFNFPPFIHPLAVRPRLPGDSFRGGGSHRPLGAPWSNLLPHLIPPHLKSKCPATLPLSPIPGDSSLQQKGHGL